MRKMFNQKRYEQIRNKILKNLPISHNEIQELWFLNFQKHLFMNNRKELLEGL